MLFGCDEVALLVAAVAETEVDAEVADADFSAAIKGLIFVAGAGPTVRSDDALVPVDVAKMLSNDGAGDAGTAPTDAGTSAGVVLICHWNLSGFDTYMTHCCISSALKDGSELQLWLLFAQSKACCVI